MEIKGQIKKIISESYGEGKSKSIVIVDTTTDQKYPKILAVTFFGKSNEAITAANLTAGTKVTIQAEASSREYNGKYYTEVSGWKFEAEAVQQIPKQQKQNLAPANDDLPF